MKTEAGDRRNLRTLWNDDFLPYLRDAVAENLKIDDKEVLHSGNLDVEKLKVQKVFESHLTVTVGNIDEMKMLCKALKKRPELLACEFLDKKRIFGDKASIDEMSSFKSKVKKQEVQYDPELEKEKENEKKRAEAEEREAKRKAEEE